MYPLTVLEARVQNQGSAGMVPSGAGLWASLLGMCTSRSTLPLHTPGEDPPQMTSLHTSVTSIKMAP